MSDSDWREIQPVPVAHIADFYDLQWQGHKCLAWQLLRRGYRQRAVGRIEFPFNNLFHVLEKETHDAPEEP